MNNEHLAGASTQTRCPSCEHRPILLDGRCLDCGFLQMAAAPPALAGSPDISGNAQAEEPLPKKRRLAPEIRGFSAPEPKPRKARKKRGEPDSQCKVYHLSECVNEEKLGDLASRQIAATWKPAGSGPMLRRIASDFLAQVREGELTTVRWEEDRMTRLGYKGRRYSGYRSTSGAEIVRFENLLASGVNAGSVGRSLFGLPGWLRDIARSGLQNCYVLDMVNAHPNIQHRRYPDFPALREYVNNREDVLKRIPASRDDAKDLFIRLVYDNLVRGGWRRSA